MTPDEAKALREEFDLTLIGKLPKVSCGACTQAAKNANRAADKHCDRHQVIECRICKAFITTGHIHLDYVGHAATTDRLLKVDPEWTWEPMGYSPDGTPALDRDGNLWIRLTVAGVTRPGVGDGSSMKEKVGDAIRNAAMRFGVALDLWAKEDLHGPGEEPSAPAQQDASAVIRDDSSLFAVKRRLMAAVLRTDVDGENAAKAWIVREMAERGLDKDSVADVKKLAEEVEARA